MTEGNMPDNQQFVDGIAATVCVSISSPLALIFMNYFTK